jgi:hypothetical protein
MDTFFNYLIEEYSIYLYGRSGYLDCIEFSELHEEYISFINNKHSDLHDFILSSKSEYIKINRLKNNSRKI